MITKRIWCSRCGYEGPREIKGTAPAESKSDVFTSEGHNPYSGKLYFRCPKCKAFITVDPDEALGSGTMNGRPSSLEAKAAGHTKLQCTLPILGTLYSGLALLIILIQTF